MGRELRNLVVKIDERITNLICLKKEILNYRKTVRQTLNLDNGFPERRKQ
jgi:hypothetical protein